MTTPERQPQLLPPEHELGLLEQALAARLQQLQTWTSLPSERVDWDLEILLDDVRVLAQQIRQMRGDQGLPF